VYFDYRSVTGEVCAKLADIGKERIAISMNDALNTNHTILRSKDFIFKAYTSFLKKRKLVFNPDYFIVSKTSEDDGYEAMKKWHKMPGNARPQAIITASVTALFGTMRFLDDHPDWRPLIVPFTNDERTDYGILLSNKDLGETAFEALKELIENAATPIISKSIPVKCRLNALSIPKSA
jgi:DNA-binding LacI/PurR family transcriptional regulator